MLLDQFSNKVTWQEGSSSLPSFLLPLLNPPSSSLHLKLPNLLKKTLPPFSARHSPPACPEYLLFRHKPPENWRISLPTYHSVGSPEKTIPPLSQQKASPASCQNVPLKSEKIWTAAKMSTSRWSSRLKSEKIWSLK